MKRLSVNVVSESAFTVQGHGVHTAFEEHVRALKRYTDYHVTVNGNQPTDIVHAHTVGPYSWRRLRHATAGKVYNAHVTPDSFVGSLRGARLLYPLSRQYLRFVYNRADRVIAVSPQVTKELAAIGVKKPVQVITNMIETRSFKRPSADRLAALRKQYSIPPNKQVVICCGQVQPRKGIADWNTVASEMPDVHFLWVGGVPFGKFADKAGEMEKLMQAVPENVTFTGVIKLAEARDLYWLAEAFWLPSYQETFGLVVIEAAACGLPVVLRDIPVYEAIFGDRYLKTKTNAGFKKMLQRLLADAAYKKNWQAQAKILASEYSSEHTITKYTKLYEELVSQSS